MSLVIHSLPLWAELISLAFCIGTLVCSLWVLSPTLLLAIPDRSRLLNRMWFSFGIATAVILAGSVADLISRAAEMSGLPIISAFPLLPAVILKTHFGWIWLGRISGLIMVALLMTAGRRHRDYSYLLYILLGIAASIAWTYSASGHASDKGDFTVPELADWLHLLGATVWGGSLLFLSLIIFPHLKQRSAEVLPVIAGLVARFSRIAGWAVGIIALTSLLQAWLYVGSVEALEKTPYGNLVLLKVVLFILLLVFAAFNRYYFLPFLQLQAGSPPAGLGIVGHFFTFVISKFTQRLKVRTKASCLLHSMHAEAGMIIALLICASLLRHEIPAIHYLHHDHSLEGGSHAGHIHGASPIPAWKDLIISLKTMPAEIRAGIPVKMTVHIEDKGGKPVKGLLTHHERILHVVIVGQDLKVFAHIHPEDLGAITQTMLEQAVFPLSYTFPKAGEYLVGLDFATEKNLYSDSVNIKAEGSPHMTGPHIDLSRSKTFGKYNVALVSSPAKIKVGVETLLTWHVEQNGKPVTDLQPYLGAPMHISVVSANLQSFMHVHGMLPGETHAGFDQENAAMFGPDIESTILFPYKGTYALFGQVSHAGKVLLFEFMVEVQ
jgi:copper resistance protein D